MKVNEENIFDINKHYDDWTPRNFEATFFYKSIK